MEKEDIGKDFNVLLQQISLGSETAFKELFLEMYPALHRISWRLCEQEEAAKDIIADVFLQLWENRTSISHINSVQAYLYVTVKNRTFNYIKKQQNEAQTNNRLRSMLPNEVSEDDALKAILDADAMRQLLKAIHTLPTECEKVVLLGLEGYSTSEIAQKLGISAPAVSQQKNRAVKLLKKHWEEAFLLALLFIPD